MDDDRAVPEFPNEDDFSLGMAFDGSSCDLVNHDHFHNVPSRVSEILRRNKTAAGFYVDVNGGGGSGLDMFLGPQLGPGDSPVASALPTETAGTPIKPPMISSSILQCCWDVPKTLAELGRATGWDSRENVNKEDICNVLANYMIILGDGNYFSYSNTQEYLRIMWGDAGHAALRILAGAVSTTTFKNMVDLEADESGPPSETLLELQTRISFRLRPELSERRSRLESALRWLCAAVRRPPPSSSGVQMDKGQPLGYQDFVWISMAEERRPSNEGAYYDLPPWSPTPCKSLPPKPSCWTDLFARGVILESPVSRTWGEGLETTFSMMVTLAGVENMYQINGGIILLGFFTALIPISRHEKTNSIQWHLEISESGIDPRHLECTKEKWFRTTDTDTLKEARCFIGWFEKAHIMLGTRQLVTDEARKLRWTGLKSRKETLRNIGREVGVQCGLTISPINIVGQSVSNFEIVNNKLRFTAPQQFSGILRQDSRKVALVVDAESRQAWLVPLLSWILHLCHRYYIEQCGHGDTPIPFAEPSSDGAKAVLSAVEDKGSTVIFGAGTEDAETLRQLWHDISTKLRTSQPDHEASQKGLIFAAEAMDIIMSQDSYPKEVPLSGTSASWAEFAKLATTTVCANLGNAIVPVPPSGKLCECCVLLERQDFLAAHTWSLARLRQRKGHTFSQLEERGLPFENGTCWRVGDGLRGLWTDCPAGDKCRNIWGTNASMSPILQRLEKVDGRRSKGKELEVEPPVYDEQVSEAGVVVFGGHSGSEGLISMPGFWKSLNASFGSLGLFPQQGTKGTEQGTWA